MNNKIQHWLHRNYWWVSTIFIIALFVLFTTLKEFKIELFLTALGAILTSIYFVQKQKLEESQLFKELFEKFNCKYGKLNEHLEAFLAEKEKYENWKDLKQDTDQYNKLVEYFNLCAEEYMYYKRGYIYPDVWKSWKNGMKYYCKNSKVLQNLWEEELGQDSYYGFDLKKLEIKVDHSQSS